MSAMSQIYLDIETMLEEGTHPSTISAVLEVPVSWVYAVVDDMSADDEIDLDFETKVKAEA